MAGITIGKPGSGGYYCLFADDQRERAVHAIDVLAAELEAAGNKPDDMESLWLERIRLLQYNTH